MRNNTYLDKEAKAWVKRKNGLDEILRIVPELNCKGAGQYYQLYTSFEENPDDLGRILFDALGYWIYDDDELGIAEQEQVARFIINYVETV
jgi:hypothetical protein